ncbi:MAG TPA: rhomboid family intramembrane serine protease [Pirellulales bacterium]|nr:rhomboid family intramembrane serine protease [Pirellulales bacterium]
MGLYDRDYYRDDARSGWSGSRSAVTTLIMINVIVYIIDIVSEGKLSEIGTLQQGWFHQPWKCYELLTSGFLHLRDDISHILFNMVALYIFGRKVEAVYGSREFVRTYLSLIVLSGLVWSLCETIVDPRGLNTAVGASGGIYGIMLIYILHFPHDEFLLFFVFPCPAWVMGILFVGYDVYGMVKGRNPHAPFTRDHVVAFTAHIGGAVFGYLYYVTRWNLFRLWPQQWTKGVQRKFSQRPPLKVHRGPPEPPRERISKRELQAKVDEILAKISRTGEESLTAEERRTLEEASRRYQQRDE